eukprot:2118316-Prymnesium_polylepis.2
MLRTCVVKISARAVSATARACTTAPCVPPGTQNCRPARFRRRMPSLCAVVLMQDGLLADRAVSRYRFASRRADGMDSACCGTQAFTTFTDAVINVLQEQVLPVPALLVQVGRARACAHAVA